MRDRAKVTLCVFAVHRVLIFENFEDVFRYGLSRAAANRLLVAYGDRGNDTDR